MAYHRHGHHHSSCCCCCCSCSSTSCHPPPAVPPSTATDPHFQAIAGQVLLQPSANLYLQRKQAQTQTQHNQHLQHQLEEATLIDSLIRRIAALESTLHSPPPRRFQHNAPPPPPQQQQQRLPSRPVAAPPSRLSLRDMAASMIQKQFRIHLVRRSHTLGQLKHLATIRSHLESEDLRVLSPRSLSRRAMDLLLHIGSVQSRDPMVREGKRSISKELMKIVEFVDVIPGSKAATLSLQEKSSSKLGIFEENGRSFPGGCDGEDAIGGNIESLKRLMLLRDLQMRQVGSEENYDGSHPSDGAQEEEVVMYEGSNSRGSDDDVNQVQGHRDHRVGSGTSTSSSCYSGNPQLGLNAPLPVKMEPRRSEFRR